MDAVFALADQLTVMVNGQVIASGSPAQIRADAGYRRLTSEKNTHEHRYEHRFVD